MALGGLAVDSSAWTHHLNVAGGNGYGGAGVRGWGLGVNYMLASNVNFEGVFYKLKPYDSNQAGFRIIRILLSEQFRTASELDEVK